MISILTQERILGAALGSAFTAVVVLENSRVIHRSIPVCTPVNPEQTEHGELGKNISSEFAHMWNHAVDGTLGRLVTYLSSHGW